MSVTAAEPHPHAVPRFDVVIVGGGVVGCATARRFSLAGAKVALVEKGTDILSGASKANSAILHTGFDAPAGSLELDLVKAGREEYLSLFGSLGLSLVETGALVCAWTPEEAGKLESIAGHGRRNGISELRVIGADAARDMVPGLSQDLCGAVEVLGEHVIDPWSAPLAYLTQAILVGAEVFRGCELLSGTYDGEWHLETSTGPMMAGAVVNAAGLFADRVNVRLGLEADFEIRPRKGQFIVLDKAAARHVPKIILPVPTEITKGIVVCPTAFGNVLVGPTAEEQEDRDRATVETETLRMLKAHGEKLIPALRDMPVTAVYAGLRPASEKKEYRVRDYPEKRAIVLGGIRSTGLSAALGLGAHALSLYEAFAGKTGNPTEAPSLTVPNLTETRERDWQRPDHGDIVCHCEMVTRREIEAALKSPLPPGDFGGLRRRTRAGMGRCQGFYCNSQLAEMTRGLFGTPLAVDGKDKP